MRWYSRLSSIRMAAVQPPSYLEERISDLEHAREFFYKDPQRARQILVTIAEQISQQHDDKFVKLIKMAVEKLQAGNPKDATEMIEATKKAMIAERTLKEREDRNPWKKQQQN